MTKALPTAELQVVVNGLLTAKDLCRLLKRSGMMIFNYRTRERDPLPMVWFGGRVVGYVKEDVIAWARRNNIHVHETAKKD